ncbi:hypothetical protein GPJ56_008719 [Histomonas meleagridis]|uniref:uncharacterized protein n=1 Tax=Histomonas meleagridis TaxID=135588 RepID=UPI00355AADFE|nr:hypothetical protein GPJ56_008719 [Histomonas meleagridis]KAH0803297.1 hypothetical protein GO595_004033 [Histomonas meleagridis]
MSSSCASEESNDKLIDDCRVLLGSQDWNSFASLYKKISKIEFIESNPKFMMLKTDATNALIEKLESITEYEQYQVFLRFLDIVVNDKKMLWEVMHTQMKPILKVTVHQAQLIAATYFKPSMLFEFGISSFLHSSTCDFASITNEEALVDVFYGIIGFINGCDLDKKYETSNKEYLDFTLKLLQIFIHFEDFDSYRFVWVIEAIKDNFRIATSTFRTMCEKVLEEYSKSEDKRPLNKLHKLCVISTSPFLCNFPIVKETIENEFKLQIIAQRKFSRKYVFSCFSTIDWSTRSTVSTTIPYKSWRLFLENLNATIQEKPELPILILADFINDSLTAFNGIYGVAQPTRERSVILRMDIFAIVDSIVQFYPMEMDETILNKIWYLLYIAAISGATVNELEEIEYSEAPEPSDPLLGLERNATGFIDYRKALGRLGQKFKDEKESLELMIKFIRQNYKFVQRNTAPPPHEV